MRAARTAPVWNWQQQTAGGSHQERLEKAERGRHQPTSHPMYPILALVTLFLVGYVGGILLCRTRVPAVGELLAEYYMDKQNFALFLPACGAQVSALFLQVLLLLLCGGNVVGFALIPAFFAGKGLLLGTCATSVLAQSGARGLVVYWLLTCVQEMAVLLLLLWIAQAAYFLSMALLKNMLNGAAVRGALKVKAKVLVMRSLLSILVGFGIVALGTGAAMLFARVLL